jgi:hypothetical protein
MSDKDQAARAEILARLAASREELKRVLDPAEPAADGSAMPGQDSGAFPRSRTMQMLMSGRGLGTLGAAAAGLLLARPAWALRVLRLLPANAVARMLVARAIAAMRTKHGTQTEKPR